jgi:predicted translin family RNA/ssDNA-binding protein
MTKWNFKTAEEFVNNNYWENSEDAIGEIRKFIHEHSLNHQVDRLKERITYLEGILSNNLIIYEEMEG